MSWHGNWYSSIASTTDLGLVTAEPILLAESFGAINANLGNLSATGAAARPWYFILVWQNDFNFIPASPQLLSSLQTDISNLSPVIKSSALKELKDAFSGVPVTVVEGTAGTGDDRATVLNSQNLVNGPNCGATNPNAILADGRVHDSQVDYLMNMENAQYAYGIQITNSQDEANALKSTNLLQAIGRGIGVTSAHEIAHHFLAGCCAMDADPAQDAEARGAINATGCSGSSDPSPWTGFWPNPIIGLHWEPSTLLGLSRCLSRGWRDFHGSSCFLQ